MSQYIVRSGQNIYDVALTLHGSVEGIFDLLVSNPWLSMETILSSGMELTYHDEFVVNKNVAMWLKSNNILVRNGEHTYNYLDIEECVKEHFKWHHSDRNDSIEDMSADEQNMFWNTLCMPRMVIQQQGQLSGITMKLKPNCHLLIDWGDYSAPQIIEDDIEQEVEHCYKGLGAHIITFYGDFEFYLLDLREVCGIHFPLDTITADSFKTELEIEDLNKLIVTQ